MTRTHRHAAGTAATIGISILVLLTACSDDRPVVGPESGANERQPATSSIIAVTTLADDAGLAEVDSRLVDSCAVPGAGLQPADYGRTYACGVGRSAFYSVAAANGTDAAVAADDAFTASGCTSDAPLPADPGAEGLTSTALGSHVLTAQYDCEDGSVNATLGLASDSRIVNLAKTVPPSPGGTYVVEDEPIDASVIAELAKRNDQFVLVLDASVTYYEAQVCDGLHACA